MIQPKILEEYDYPFDRKSISWDFPVWEKPRKRIRVYVASPYGRRIGNSDKQCEDNVQRAIDAGRELITLGYIPLVANLYHYLHRDWLDSPDEDRWLEMCMAWLPFCNALLRLPGKSHGADAEVARALELGIPVYYSLGELKNGKVSS